MSAPLVHTVVVTGRDAPLWLAAATLARALEPAGVRVTAIELPSALEPADVYPTLPALEALHNQLRIDEEAMLRACGGAFSLGQNFVEPASGTPGFLHPYGAFGTAIDGQDFFAFWLKARRHGLSVGLEHFSLTAAAARHGRLLIPDDETERYGRSDYGYHLPAAAYARVLKAVATGHGVTARHASAVNAVRGSEKGDIAALVLDSAEHVAGDLFIDASGPGGELIGGALGIARESWRAHFPADRVLAASAAGLRPVPSYAEVRAWRGGWTALYPGAARTHVVQAYAQAQCSDDEALRAAAKVSGLALAGPVVRTSDPGRRERAWAHNCIAIGSAACSLDPIHGLELHAVQLGLIHLLGCFPAGAGFAAQRTEYNRRMRDSFERLRDFQSAHYALARYDGPFWTAAREARLAPELAHAIAIFAARGEVPPMEEQSFAPDSWRALFIGHGFMPESHLPVIDRTTPDEMKAQFRRMLGFVKEQVLRQPTHDDYLRRIAERADG